MRGPRQYRLMSKAELEDQLDHLYKLPLDEFTGARNTLARESGNNAIKKLEKPNVAAWAVNQLHWRERKLYDEVIKTAGQVRTAYKQMLAGKPTDVRAVEVFHGEALRHAKHAIRRILEEAGHKGADAVMMPIAETLDALPSTDPPGRLTKPLRRIGFEALHGVTIAARPKATAKVEPKKTPAEKESDNDRRKREADQQAMAMARERLRFAEAAEREAQASLDRAKRTLERAERTRERIEGEFDAASIAERSARKDLASSEAAYAKVQAERDRLDKRIRG